MSRYYQAPGSGIIFYQLTLLAWFILLLSFCLEIAMNYYLASGQIGVSKLTGLAIIWTLVAASLSFLILKLFLKNDYFSFPGISVLEISVYFISGNLLISFFSALFYAVKDFISPNLLQIINNSILILMIPKKPLGFLLADHFIYIYFTSFILLGILMFFLFLVKYVPGMKIALPDRVDMKWLLGMSIWAFWTNALSMLLYRVDYWYVNHFCSALELGNYVQASKIGQIFLVLPAMVSTAIFPITASGSLENPEENIQSLSRILWFFTIIPAAILLLSGKWIFPYAFGSSFELMYTPFALLLPGELAFCIICPITSYYGGKKILYVNLLSISIAVVFVFVLDYFTVHRFGIKAAAIVSSLGYMLYAGCLLCFFNKHHQVSMKNFFTIRYSDFRWLKNLTGRKSANSDLS